MPVARILELLTEKQHLNLTLHSVLLTSMKLTKPNVHKSNDN